MNKTPVFLPETQCLDNQNSTFNPTYDYEWKLPLSQKSNVEIELRNKIGQVLLQKTLDYGEEFRWNGIFNSGNQANPGRYNWYVKHQNGEVCIIKMTIIN